MSSQPIHISNLLSSYNMEDLNEEDRSNLVKSAAKLDPQDNLNDFLSNYFSSEIINNYSDLKKASVLMRFCIRNKIKTHSNIEKNQKLLRNIETIKKLQMGIIRASTICQNLPRYHLNSQIPVDKQLLIEIAKLVASKDPCQFCENIKKFKLDSTDPESRQALIEIAKLVASKEPRQFCENIKKFKLDSADPESKQALIEIATACASACPSDLCDSIHNFRLDASDPESKKALIEIAKVCAGREASAFCYNMENFGLDTGDRASKEALIDIMRAMAIHQPDAVCNYIRNFGLNPKNANDRQVLIDIAKTSARENARTICTNIQKFGLNPHDENDRRELINILKISADQDPVTTFFFIENCQLEFTSIEETTILKPLLNKIFIHFIKSDNLGYVKINAKQSVIKEFSPIYYNFFIAYCENDVERMKSVLKEALSKKEELKPLFNLEHLPKRNEIKIIALLCYTLFTLDSFSASDRKESLAVLQEILTIAQPQLRYQLVDRLEAVLSDPKAKESFFKLCQKFPNSFKLPFLYCILAEMPQQELSRVVDKLNLNAFKKDGDLRRLTLETLENLLQISDLGQRDKSWLISQTFNGNARAIKSTVRILKAATSIGVEEGLSKENLEKVSAEDFQTALKTKFTEHFKGLISISVENQNFYTKYEKTIGSFRDPQAPFQYLLGSIRKLKGNERESVEKAYTRVIDAMLDESFETLRYDKELNPHLKAVFSTHPQLETLWRGGSEMALGIIQDTKASSLDFKKSFIQSFGDKHFSARQFPELIDYLQSGKTNQETLKNRLKEIAGMSRQQKQALSDELGRLNFTLKAIQLMESSGEEKISNLLTALINLDLARDQFKTDLEDWQKMLGESKSPSPQKSLKVVEGDHPCDILLCGTEVLGSCQAIGGSSYLNKCLVGYLANGQNRLIAVKSSDGRISSRALVRILLREGKPVLFLERLYPSNIRESEKDAIYQMAVQKAQKMGLPLYESFNQGMVNKGAPIQSSGGQAPYDYVDASDGIAENSIYSINHYSTVWEPESEPPVTS